MPPRARHSRRRRVALVALIAVLALGAGAAWWLQPAPLLPEAEASLTSTTAVSFDREDDGRLVWRPAAVEPTVGLVIYPGGKVPPTAYGPLAASIAAAGFLVVIEPMPLNLAVLGVGKADEAIAAEPSVEHWALAGHSLGGAMAASYVADHPAIEGLALWAAYPTSDLSTRDLAAVSVWGSLDAGAARMGGAEARRQLPADAVFLELPGGNHEQMGWYTGQPNDPPATLPRAEQQRRVAEATISLLVGLAGS